MAARMDAEVAGLIGAPERAETSADATPNVLVVPREGKAGNGAIVIEIENRPGKLTLQRAARDVLSDTQLSGEIEVRPYQVMVLRH
jgi:hypothetical protein